MNAHDVKITKAILDVLHDLDGRQASEITLHTEVNIICPCLVGEFETVLKECERRRYITGVQGKFTQGRKWNIADAGEAARIEMA